MKPLNSLILVKYEEPTEKKTEAGLYVPPAANTVTASNFLKEGVVVAVNPKEENIKENDTILFNYNARVKVPGEKDLIMVRSEDIYAVK